MRIKCSNASNTFPRALYMINRESMSFFSRNTKLGEYEVKD